MKKTLYFVAVICLLMFIPCTAFAAEKTITETDDLRAAIATLSAGDKLIIEAGNYTLTNASLQLPENIIIEGVGEVNVTTAYKAETSLQRIKGKNFTIDNINFLNPTGCALPISGSGVIKNCTIDGYNGMRQCYISSGKSLQLINCEIYGDNYGMHFAGDGGTLEITECAFQGITAIAGSITPVAISDSSFAPSSASGSLSFYQDATVENCEFAPTVSIKASKAGKTLHLNNSRVTDDSDIKFLASGNGTIFIDGVPLKELLAICPNGDVCTEHVAAIGNKHYASLEEAIAAAEEAGDGTIITILKDIVLDKVLEIEKDVEIRGNHSITRAEGYSDLLFKIKDDATLTLGEGLDVDISSISTETNGGFEIIGGIYLQDITPWVPGGVPVVKGTDGKWYVGNDAAKAPIPTPEPVSPQKNPSGNGISIFYEGGNCFRTTNPETPTAVKIDGVITSFCGDGSCFYVDCIPANADWITVCWNNTSVTTSFTPDANIVCTEVEIPKTGDASVICHAILAIVAAAGLMRKEKGANICLSQTLNTSRS